MVNYAVEQQVFKNIGGVGAGIHFDKDYVSSGGAYGHFDRKESDSNRSNIIRRHAKDVKPDVFGITESWLRDDIDRTESGQDRRDTHNGISLGSLTVHYVRADIVSVEKSQLQGSFVKRSGSVITIGVVCLTPNSGEDDDGLLFDSIRKAAKSDVVIIGDFNFPDINWLDGSSGRNGNNF
ncbi:hypothetical protein BSL78_22727 [Apostichopus japonicus]|uniref:Endonuclease/exonuclease/phosphatase domain-containing protein n=1 Tax=Stichopus japonicus TaxID=307972 RepID=A0A2G8JXI1_STIJA|nr:hypothetical protein BSL78_22727 [Apostichopus japonicus]